MAKRATESAAEAAAREAYGAALEVAPSELAGRSAAEPEVVRWVARNIDNPNATPADCPDPFAWTLLRQCRENPGFVAFFIEKLWSKLIPSRAQLEDQDKPGDRDGSQALEVIRRLQGIAQDIGSRVEQLAARQTHTLEVGGSSPPPATKPVLDAFSQTEGEPE